MQLTDASGGGTIGLDRVANITIPANDNPYGTVAFVQSVYRVQEPLERSSCANITVRRRYMRCGCLYPVGEGGGDGTCGVVGKDLLHSQIKFGSFCRM